MTAVEMTQDQSEAVEWFTDDPAYNSEGLARWLAHQPVGAAEGDDVVISKGVLRMGRWYMCGVGEVPMSEVHRCVIGVAPLTEAKPTYPIKVQVHRVPGTKKFFHLKYLGQFRVDVFQQDPSEFSAADAQGNLHSRDWVSRADLPKHAREYWRAGYWLEIFDNAGELKAGPISPEAPFPALIF